MSNAAWRDPGRGRRIQGRGATRTLAALSLFTLAPVLIVPAGARAEGTAKAAQEDGGDGDDEQPKPAHRVQRAAPHVVEIEDEAGPMVEPPVQPAPFEQARPHDVEVVATEPTQFPDPYLPPPDPYESAADPSQIDWPQDVAAEEAVVDSYDDGYDPQAYTEFQDELAPHGNWIDDASYGRVWAPNASAVGADFTPYYSGGHWALTEFGWTWVSDWSWGWAPFHYGRWIVLAGYGWCWVPGTMWGPAWVTWRSGSGWVGWAALPPRGVSVTTTYGRRTPWRFTRAADLGAPRLRCLPLNQMRGVFRHTTNVANDRVLTRGRSTVHINAGPRYIPNAKPTRLKAVAPHAFPQRAIFPRPGVKMAARPWIRAARAAAAAPAGSGGAPIGGGGGGGGRVWGGGLPGRGAPPPQIYSPPRPSGVTAAPHTFTPPAHAGGAPAHLPRVYDPPPAFARPASGRATPHAGGMAPPPSSGAPRVHDPGAGRGVFGTPTTFSPPPAGGSPRTFDTPPTFAPPRTFGSTPAFAPPRTFGNPPAGNPAQVYNPPPRAFATPPTVNPTRSFGGAAPVFNAPQRSFSAPPVQHAAPQPMNRGFSRPQMHAPSAPVQRSFSPPAGGFSPPAGGFNAPGGGRFGGGRR
jgi:hypothetical protein